MNQLRRVMNENDFVSWMVGARPGDRVIYWTYNWHTPRGTPSPSQARDPREKFFNPEAKALLDRAYAESTAVLTHSGSDHVPQRTPMAGKVALVCKHYDDGVREMIAIRTRKAYRS